MSREPYNIIWALIDSVRTYRSGADDRDRLEMMDVFAKESVEFTNAITSAPSTVMAVTAMHTSLPAYYISRNYDSFAFDTTHFPHLNGILKEMGYDGHALFQPVEIREKLKDVVNQVDRKYWPKGIKYDAWITNNQFNAIFENLAASGNLKKPSFLYWHYNCRLDPKTSDYVQEFLDRCNALGYTENNTIFIICSDHGYPDPRRGFSPEEFHRRNLTHDIHLSDDNIRVPLFIKYPGCPKGKKVDTTISLLDITPTLLELVGVDLSQERFSGFQGHSLVPLIENDDDRIWQGIKIRTDNRFLAQTGRCTSIRGADYKYIYHHDTKHEEFFDLKNDPDETKNLINTKQEELQQNINKYRDEFHRAEKKAIEFQFRHIMKQFQKKFSRYKSATTERPMKVLITDTCLPEYSAMLSEIVKNILKPCEIDHFDSQKGFEPQKQTMIDKDYDLILVPYDNQISKNYTKIMALMKSIKKEVVFPIDYNMNIYQVKGEVRKYFERLYERRHDYWREPSLLWTDCMMYTRKAINLVRIKFKKEDWNFKDKATEAKETETRNCC